MREPFNMSFEQISGLTDDQIAFILFHPRDDKDQLAVAEKETESNDFGEVFRKTWKLHRPEITEDELRAEFVKAYGEPDIEPDRMKQIRAEIDEMWERVPDPDGN